MYLMKKLRYLSFFFIILFPPLLQAEVIGYMDIPEIPGNATALGYQDLIEIHGFGLGIEVPTTVTDGTRSTGRADFSPIRVTKNMEGSSPLLYLKVAESHIFPEITIYLVTDTGFNYFTVELRDVIIAHIVPSVGSANATEMISLDATVLIWTSNPEPGSGDSPITTGWNRETNAPL